VQIDSGLQALIFTNTVRNMLVVQKMRSRDTVVVSVTGDRRGKVLFDGSPKSTVIISNSVALAIVHELTHSIQ